MMDRLDEWRVFVTVAGLRSFAGAARTLGRSPQAVTRAVAALEARLGARLLNRTTRAVSLTNDGERLLERGRRALADFDLLEAGDDPRAPLTGRLSLTAPVLFGQLHVVPVVAELLARHPGVDVRLALLDRVVSLAEDGIDVAVRLGPLPDSSLRARLVGQVRDVLCASPAYLKKAGVPRTPEALAKHACIAFSGTTPIADRWAFSGARPGQRERTVHVRPRLVVNTAQAAIDAACAGLGVVRVISYQVAALVAAKKLQVVLAAHARPAFPAHLVYPPGPQPRVVVAFVDLATERIRARLT
jgi:DNA-binding transcriptional LysR family regulator